MKSYDNNITLDQTLAKTVFDTWQLGVIDSRFSDEQRRSILGKFIMHYVMIIIMFCYIKYRNRITIYIRILYKK